MKIVHKLLVSAAAALALIPVHVRAASQKEPRVTQVIREVKLLPSEKDPRPAEVNDRVPEDTAVRTGDKSRSELTFADLTISRLGANTIYSYAKEAATLISAAVRFSCGCRRIPAAEASGRARSALRSPARRSSSKARAAGATNCSSSKAVHVSG